MNGSKIMSSVGKAVGRCVRPIQLGQTSLFSLANAGAKYPKDIPKTKRDAFQGISNPENQPSPVSHRKYQEKNMKQQSYQSLSVPPCYCARR